MELSRRNFLVGAASAGVLGAMAGLTGCAPQASSASAKNGDASSADAAVARPTYYMCDEDWLGSAPEIADADIKETKSFDVVVVGGGHAGTQAALAAAQEGAKVAVIEKHNDGEIVYRGDDICSYNSKMLEAWGFGPYDLDEIVNEYVRRANGRCNTEVIRSFVYNSGEMMDNLASLIPDTSDVFDYEGGQCIVQIAYDKPSGADYPVEVSGYKMWASTVQTVGTKNEQPVGKKQKTGISRLSEIEEYCRDAAEDLGAEWFCGQTAARCVQDADGAVKGIIAEDADGNYVKFEAAKGVILATGDFGGNTDMVWELCSECAENAERHGVDRAELMGMTDCDGSGHKIGCWAGGAIESHPRPVAGDAPSISFGPWGSTPCLWMNCNGQRFMNEDVPGQNIADEHTRQPVAKDPELAKAGVKSWQIFDSKWPEQIIHMPDGHGYTTYFVPDDKIAEYETVLSGFGLGYTTQAMVDEAADVKCDTLEELAEKTGLPYDTMKAEIERYNELCHNGLDEDFGKMSKRMFPVENPPYYACKFGNAGMLVMFGGLECNHDLQVTKDGTNDPIPGLYVAGNTMGRRLQVDYPVVVAGISLATALSFGRLAGKNAAAAV